VLIFDEVISLRADYGGMQSVLGVTPDLTAMGKIIGGGFPVGAVGGSAEVMAVFDPTGGPPRAPHGGTFNANPVTMVAGLTAMRKLTPAEFDRLASLGQQLRAGIDEVLREAGVPGQTTGHGSLFHIHLHQRPLADYRNSILTAEERAFVGRVHEALMGRGIFITPALFGCLSTPMGVPEVEAFVDAFAAALNDARD